MVPVKQFKEHPNELEIFWLTSLTETAESGWTVLAAVRDVRSDVVGPWRFPIGMLPRLAPGRVYVQGIQSRTPYRGRSMVLRIDDVSAAEEVTTQAIPPEVFSFRDFPYGVQHLLRYQQGNQVVLVPTIEMVRYLFLHNKTMANALMRPSALNTLCCAEEPGFHPNLHLRFTSDMPRNCLSDAFISEFAWTAVHPDGRRSWDSVRDQTLGQRYVSFQPPPLVGSTWSVRALESEGTVLVLEISAMTGKCYPCDTLSYSHPSIRATKAFRPAGFKTREDCEEDQARAEEPANAHDPSIDITAAGSRTNVHQAALHTPAKLGTFDRKISIKRVALPARPSALSDQDRSGHKHFRARRDRQNLRRLQRSASVGEQDASSSVAPLEFRLLDPAGPEEVAALEPMMTVVGLMAKDLPTVCVASSVCLLKGERAFSMVGRHRRPCLIAVFTPASGIPVVLVSVDLSGERALSCLALMFSSQCNFATIETHINDLLDGLVDHGGHWETAAVEKRPALSAVKRFRRVLRCHTRLKDSAYLEAWAVKLSARLGLARVKRSETSSP